MALFQKAAIGLDISDRSIEAVLVVQKGGRYVLASYGRTLLKPGLVVDGAVQRRDELSVALRKLLADQMTPRLPNGIRRVVFALPESQVYTHVFEVPRLADESELGRSLALEADGFFPYNHQEMASGYAVIAQRPDKKEIFYAAALQSVLKGFLSLFAVSGLEPVAIEGEATSIARAVLPAGDPDPAAIVDIGARVTNLSIFDRNGIQFSESLQAAGDAFDQAIAQAMGVTIEDAEELKKNRGLSGDFEANARRALAKEVDALIADVRDAVAFYERRSGRVVQRVLLCGGSSAMPGLLEYVTERLPTNEHAFQVELADPWMGIELDPMLEKVGIRARGSLVATAIGLGLRGAGARKFPEIDLLASLRHKEEVVRPRGLFPGLGRLANGLSRAPATPLYLPKKSLPLAIRIGIGATAVVALAAAVWAGIFILYPRFAGPAERPVEAGLDQIVEIKRTVELGASFSEETGKIQVVPVEAEESYEATIEREGVASEGLAKGRLRLINATGRAQALVERTRLLSSGGVLFRLDNRVTVPANGSVEASVTADRPGADGDVPPGRFTIPGLSAALQSQIYGESSEAFTGGVAYTGAPLAAEELEAAKTKLLEPAAEALFARIQEKAAGDVVVLKDLFALRPAELTSAPEVGKPTGDYLLAVTAFGKALGFDPEQMNRLLARALAETLPPGTPLEGYVITDIAYRVETLDIAADTATLTVTAVAKKAER